MSGGDITYAWKVPSVRAGFSAVMVCMLLSACQQDAADTAPVPVMQTSDPAYTLDEVVTNAMTAMAMTDVDRIAISANGWEACLGQPWNIHEGWARWSITDYQRVIEYSTTRSYQSAQRQAGMDPDMLGGCGAQPDAAAQNQRSQVNADSPWLQQLQVHLTPAGFLQLATMQAAQVNESNDGLLLAINNVESAGVSYDLVGNFGDDLLLDRIITHIDDSVFGNMAFEVLFSDYQDFSGVMFPAHIEQKQGGYTTLNLDVSAVMPNTSASVQPPESNGGRFGGGQQPDLPPYEMIGEGIYALHGAYQSVVMEFEEFSVVLDGLQSDSRTREIIAITRELIPDKPIGYVLSTHAHFDHASGLRQFVAEGAGIITHETNAAFFDNALSQPRTLNPDAEKTAAMVVNIVPVQDFYAIDDGSQRVEFHKLNGSRHADDVLIAYIPSINTVVEADLLQPWINPVFGGREHPFLVWFADELDRLALDVEQFVPVHRPSNPPLMTRQELLEAVGRN